MTRALIALILSLLVGIASAPAPVFAQGADPLPSWNEGAAKRSIVSFVTAVTTPGSPDFVAPEQRVATFDNDGTLWCEKPLPVQLYFALDRVKALQDADCVPLKTIEELRDIAYSIVGEPEKVQFGDRIVGIIEARDGTVMDVVREVKPFSFRED